MRRVATPLLALAVAAAIFIVSTIGFFYYRDNFSTHFPIKAVSASILRGGSIPYWNYGAGGGQPLAGNPNTLTFYPDTLLYLFLPAHVAFNLHFLLHLLAAWFIFRMLLALFGCDRPAQNIGATLYVFSGAAISTLVFYNLVVAIPLLPLIILVMDRFLTQPSFMNALGLGGCCGLLGLGGEPVMVISAIVLIVALSFGRLRKTMFLPILLSIVTAVGIVSPLLVTYGEIASEVERGFQPYSAQTVLAASLRPARLIEIITGPFLGLITDLGQGGFHIDRIAGEWPPLLPLLFLGAIVIPAFAFPDRGTVRLRVAGFLFLFLAMGRYNPIVARLVEAWPAIRIVRYPEKFAIPFTLAAVVAVAVWLQARRRSRQTDVAIALSLVALVIFGALRFASSDGHEQKLRLLAGSVVAVGVLFAALQFPVRPRFLSLLLALTFVPLFYWDFRALPIDRWRPYSRPSPLSERIEGRVWSAPPVNALRLTTPQARAEYRVFAATLAPLSGMRAGVRYAFDRSPEGMYSFLSRITQERFTSAAWPMKLRYLRLLGVGSVISQEPLSNAELLPSGIFTVAGNTFHRYRIANPLPEAMVIPALYEARSIQEAVQRMESNDFRLDGLMVVPKRKRPVPAAPMSLIAASRTSTEIRLHVLSERGGSLLVNESYFNAWVAEGGGRRLSTFPVNIDRLGIEVPPGEMTITLRFGAHRQLVSFCVLLSATLIVLSLTAVIRSRYSIADPAR